MTCCSAIACSSLISRRARITAGRRRSTAKAWSGSGPGSVVAQMPNQIAQIVEERIAAFWLGHPGLGPRRIAAMLAQAEWGALCVSPSGVWKGLRRHGISTRARRLSLIVGYRAPYEAPREAEPEAHVIATGRASWSAST